MKRITLLPHWVLPDTLPSVYDTQSGTALEMVSKVYGAMRTLQDDYNSFADEINKTITEFIESTNQDQECFRNKITKIMHEYIAKIDEKIKMQDLVINNAIDYMKTNLVQTITTLIQEMKEMGELDETILNALDNISTKIQTLETFKTASEIRLTNLETFKTESEERLTDLESTRSYSSYDESTETLTIVFDEKEGDE